MMIGSAEQKPLLLASAAAVSLAILAYKFAFQGGEDKKTLLEKIGGEAAVDAAVELFYKKMLSDERVKRFFEKTNMVHQKTKQRNFLLYVLDGGNRHKYRGMSMDRAHRRLIEKEGMTDFHFNATAENLDNTLKELGVADDVRTEVMTAVESLREQVMCRGQWAIEKKAEPAAPQQKSLYERLGGEAAVNAAVEKFYKRMLEDERVSRFFKNTNMAKQHMKQVSFMSYAFGAPLKKYSGLAMDVAHRRLIEKEGMNDSHFDAVKENLDLTLAEMGVPADMRKEVDTAVEGLRDQVMCRGQWAISKPKVEEKSLYERLGGDAAVHAAVEKFYKRMLEDDRVSRFFKNTNMTKQHMKQVAFMSYAFGAPKKYSGLAMDKAHKRLIEQEGMNDSHFDAVKENLDLTLAEMGVPKELRDEVSTAVEGLREQVMCRGQWAS